MPTYYYQRKGNAADQLTAATGLQPSESSTRSIDEQSWPFPRTLTVDEKAALDTFMANEGFFFARES